MPNQDHPATAQPPVSTRHVSDGYNAERATLARYAIIAGEPRVGGAGVTLAEALAYSYRTEAVALLDDLRVCLLHLPEEDAGAVLDYGTDMVRSTMATPDAAAGVWSWDGPNGGRPTSDQLDVMDGTGDVKRTHRTGEVDEVPDPPVLDRVGPLVIDAGDEADGDLVDVAIVDDEPSA